MTGTTLSVCLIIRDEERVLGRCLSSAVQFADELIVVDTGSKDRSVKIAEEYTELVYNEPWQNSFAKARNFAASLATCDYVMWLDADDVIYPEQISKILKLKELLEQAKSSTQQPDVIFMTYRNYGYLSDIGIRDRIHRREFACLWQGDVHEAIMIDGTPALLSFPDITIIHKKEHINEPGRNMRIFQEVKKDGRLKGSYALAYYCRELSLINDMDGALRTWQELLDSAPRVNDIQYALSFISYMLIRLGKYGRCRELISESFEKLHVPKMAFLLYRQGLAAERMGDRDEARRLYHLASDTPVDTSTGMIEYNGFNDYLAPLKLCALAYDDGDFAASEEWNNKAGAAWPEGAAWRINRELFFTPDLPEGREPLISVIMTSGADEIHRDEAIESIKNQTWKNTEIITVGGRGNGSGSDAETIDQAISQCRGEYIAFMNSSDISLPERLEAQVKYLEHNKDIMVLGTGLFPSSPEHYLARMLLLRPEFPARTVMTRKDFIINDHISFGEGDAELMGYRFLMEASKCGAVSCLAGVHYKVRQTHEEEQKTDMDKKLFDGIRSESLLLSGVKLSKEDEARLARLLPDGKIPIWNRADREELTRILGEIRSQLEAADFKAIKAYEETVLSVLYN